MKVTRVAAFAGFGTLAVIVIVVAVWQLNPWRDQRAWVPTCSDLAAPTQTALGGAWSVGSDDSDRKLSDSSTSCDLAFNSPDQRFSGTVHVLLNGETSNEAARDQAEGFPCSGVSTTSATAAQRYSVYRTCAEFVAERYTSSVVAAGDERWLRMTLSTSVPADGTTADTSRFADETLQTLADQGVTLSERG